MKLLYSIKIIYETILGECIKLKCKIFGFKNCRPLGGLLDGKDLIVSITSYGRRVDHVLPYAIYSLFRQTIMPTKIVLVLDDGDKKKYHKSLESFKHKGLSILYDDRNLKPYKKLIPVMELYPDSIIITVDDDAYYKENFVKNMIESYFENKHCIHANMLHQITIDKDGNLNKYKDWIDDAFVKSIDLSKAFPIGLGGIMYQKDLLFRDVCNVDLFKTLSPNADDIWFFIMAKLVGTKYKKVIQNRNCYHPLDNIYQITHRGARLSDMNCYDDMNDVQISKVFDYYKKTINELLPSIRLM